MKNTITKIKEGCSAKTAAAPIDDLVAEFQELPRVAATRADNGSDSDDSEDTIEFGLRPKWLCRCEGENGYGIRFFHCNIQTCVCNTKRRAYV